MNSVAHWARDYAVAGVEIIPEYSQHAMQAICGGGGAMGEPAGRAVISPTKVSAESVVASGGGSPCTGPEPMRSVG